MGLFEPAWKNKNLEKAMSSIYKINDEKKLREIIEYDGELDIWVRATAVSRLPDYRKKLLDTAKNGEDYNTRKAAMQLYTASKSIPVKTRIDDQGILDCIHDPFVIADILCHETMILNTALSLMEKINNQEALFIIAKNGKKDHKSLAAARLTDRELIKQLDEKTATKRLCQLDVDAIASSYACMTGTCNNDYYVSVYKGTMRVGDTLHVLHISGGDEKPFVLKRMFDSAMGRDREITEFTAKIGRYGPSSFLIPRELLENLNKRFDYGDIVYVKK